MQFRVGHHILRKNIEELEKVQTEISKLVPMLESLFYDGRCKWLGFTLLGKRRLRCDLIEALIDYENVDREIFFELARGTHQI